MEDLRFETIPAGKVSTADYELIQDMQRRAAESVMHEENADKLDHLFSINNPDRYVQTRQHPEELVGHEFNDDQAYTVPRVTLAKMGELTVGYLYTAHNASTRFHLNGGYLQHGAASADLTRKQVLFGAKDYLWLREVAVEPAYQHQKVATKLLKTALAGERLPYRRVSTYIWPGEITFLYQSLVNLGFRRTGESEENIFGNDTEAITQFRMQADSVSKVRKALAQKL